MTCTTSSWSDRVKKIRKQYGWTQEQLAERLRLHVQTIRVWENELGDPLGPAEIVLEQLEKGQFPLN